MKLGVVILGLSNLSERSGTWDADYYLSESWRPDETFTPQTEIVNEVARLSTQYDITEVRDGVCVRSRRIRSTLRTPYNLRAFPFDQQILSLELSDDEFTSAELSYSDAPDVIGLDDAVRTTLSSWKIEKEPAFRHEVKAFRWEKGAPPYDNATVQFVVRRHVTYHLFKFFLPLLVIVALAFTVFWIDPDDLSAPSTIGVTCLLAAIAFQFAEASTLPEVAYLTLADRVYVACYIAIGAALIETIYSSALARGGMKTRALALDRQCRLLFPAGLALALVFSIARAFTE
ncbi:MAG TPA: hypothetical protein VGL61_00270 [Kofleriaceae bacterium]